MSVISLILLSAPDYVDVYSFSVHGCNGIRTGYGPTNLILRDIEVYNNGDSFM